MLKHIRLANLPRKSLDCAPARVGGKERGKERRSGGLREGRRSSKGVAELSLLVERGLHPESMRTISGNEDFCPRHYCFVKDVARTVGTRDSLL